MLQLQALPKCIDEINRHIADANEDKKIILYAFKGKALFCIYEKEKFCLQKHASVLPPQRFFAMHTACCSKLKEIILLLGHLLDIDQLDDEGLRMLDFAMMDYICETNKLYECHRCYLCRNNLACPEKVATKSAGKN